MSPMLENVTRLERRRARRRWVNRKLDYWYHNADWLWPTALAAVIFTIVIFWR